MKANPSIKMKVRYFLFIGAILSLFVAHGQKSSSSLRLGAEQFDQLLPKLANQRVALLVNNTSVVGNTHLVDSLYKSKVNIVKIFSPEHGFRGKADAGELVSDEKDASTGIAIVSLYGKNKKPTAEQLADVDVVIFDIQDIGARFFTYISSMHYLMEACAESDKKVIILDRPNPNGHYVDGPILKPELKSFVGMHPIPIVHGLTVGELAQMINGEGWLAGNKKCQLEVIAMKNYTHQTKYSLPIKPSPNLPNDHAIAMYPTTCLLEGTTLSVGRGTTFPFEVAGHPDLKGYKFQFTPVTIEGMAKNPPHENKICHGLDLRKAKPTDYVSLKYIIELYKAFPDKEKFFNNYFNTLAGNKDLKEQIKKGLSEKEIHESWKPELEKYKEMRKKYLLYP
jgi:uncharacterized protein YbbC (DUF1343 family)